MLGFKWGVPKEEKKKKKNACQKASTNQGRNERCRNILA